MIRTQSLYLCDVGPSTNVWYVGTHWATRKKIADHWHTLVVIWVKKYHILPVDHPVVLEFDLCFGPRRKAYDVSNGAATVKLVEDGLVKAKILRGDGPAYVTAITIRSIPKQMHTYTMVRIIEDLEGTLPTPRQRKGRTGCRAAVRADEEGLAGTRGHGPYLR